MKTKKKTQLTFKKSSIIELSNSAASKIIGGAGETPPTRPTSSISSILNQK